MVQSMEDKERVGYNDSGSKISNSGFTEAEKDYDAYFDHNEVEEYINIRDSDQSCHILPLSNTKYNSGDS